MAIEQQMDPHRTMVNAGVGTAGNAAVGTAGTAAVGTAGNAADSRSDAASVQMADGAGGRAPRRRPGSRGARLALLAALLVAAGGCSLFEAPVVQRGHRVTADLLQDIRPGVHTRADVQALLGTPTTTSSFGAESWYYISSNTRQRPGRALLVSDQETVAVAFDPGGVVTAVRVVTEAEAQPVTMVARQTPSPGTERTLMQALFGNVGRFGPGALGGATAGSGPGAPR